MKTRLPLLLIFSVLFSFVGQLNAQDFWKKLSKNDISIPKSEIYQKKNTPKKFNLVSLDLSDFQSFLNSKTKNSRQIIKLPNADGGFSKFRIKETSNFESALSKKFPNIKSYSAQGIDDPTAVAKISFGADGLHAIIFSGIKNTVYIDPYTKDNKSFIVYKRNDLNTKKDDFICEVESFQKKNTGFGNSLENANDGKLRTFRLALACTGEYAQFHLSRQNIDASATDEVKKAAVLSAMNTSMTRINGLYERDLSVKFVLVADNDKLIFLDPDTDDLTNNSASTLINQSQTVCDNIIGNANYDIGHTFSTGAGGLAGKGVVCIQGSKARGVTGTDNPVSDPFDVDFVAHEIGHQFGANHTFNGTTGNCSGGNRNNATAVEPGSGTTIMAYAGICGSQNVQNNSDDHFHSVSIAEMWNIIQSTGNCATLTDTNNNAPTITAITDYTIPKSTPFVLRGNANDVDGNSSLTYNWEQIDTEVGFAIPPVSTNAGGAMFRSLSSKNSPDRYMPDLATVLAGNTSTTWEVLPSVAREMNFSLLVRDNAAGGASTARDDVKVTVADAEAFTVSAPSSAVSWDVGTTQTITWNKGTTNEAPINSLNVNIKLSVDGGLTFPITLKSNTPNDGTEDIVIPNNPTTTARIMVEAADNIFYNVNSTNFTLNSTDPTFIMTNTDASKTVCNSTGVLAVYDFNFEYLNGFTESVSLSATGNPSGSSVTFSPTSITSAVGTSTTFTLTVGDLENVPIGQYTINVKGTSASITRSLDVILNLYSNSFATISLASPSDAAVDVTLKPTLTWNKNDNATTYFVEVSENNNFSSTVVNQEVNGNTYTLSNNLNGGVVYYWRIKAKNLCGESYSATRSFTTVLCLVCQSSGLDAGGTSTTLVKFNTIDNATAKSSGYSDYRNIKTEVKRGETHELTINVNTDGVKKTQTKVWIDWNQNCDFTDAGEEYNLGSAEDKANDPTSESPISITIPNNAEFGELVMRVSTINSSPFGPPSFPLPCDNNFTGEVEDYTIEVVDPTASIKDIAFEGFNLFPNPSEGRFTLNLKAVQTDKVSIQLFDVRGRLIQEKIYRNVKADFSENIFFEKASKGLYLLKVHNGNKQTTRKLLIN